mmetsp:Transcript_20275/g.28513  ORF Transcript_20275/g.28513 Transcript_20275/m.28513 type:complete len:100 (-) Transcript_20275:257-556(-)
MQMAVSEIQYPFAVAHGGHDEAVKIEGTEMLMRSSKTPKEHKEQRTFKDAYHDLLGDPDRNEVVTYLFEWAEMRLKNKDELRAVKVLGSKAELKIQEKM